MERISLIQREPVTRWAEVSKRETAPGRPKVAVVERKGMASPARTSQEVEAERRALGGQASPAVLRRITDTVGIDPFDVDLDQLEEHQKLHERDPKSRLSIGSPCARVRDIDVAVHRILPGLLQDKYPEMAKRLLRTSPRWGKLAHPEREDDNRSAQIASQRHRKDEEKLTQHVDKRRPRHQHDLGAKEASERTGHTLRVIEL